MKPKFRMFSFVRVTREMPPHMSHFHSAFDAIVKGTYSQLYGGDNNKQYSLYIVENGKVVGNVSWYYEDQLTLLSENVLDAVDMVETYLNSRD